MIASCAVPYEAGSQAILPNRQKRRAVFLPLPVQTSMPERAAEAMKTAGDPEWRRQVVRRLKEEEG